MRIAADGSECLMNCSFLIRNWLDRIAWGLIWHMGRPASKHKARTDPLSTLPHVIDGSSDIEVGRMDV